jgi:TRAP-type C4-dicarboxylate transport system permease small subunit
MKLSATELPPADAPSVAPPDTEEHILTESGEFNLHDAVIDLRRYHAEDWLALGLFWLLGVTVFYQFFTRYALNDSAAWTEEIARYFLIATVFIGATMAVRKNNHIQVDFFYRLLPAKLMRVMATLVDVARVSFLLVCVGLTWQLMNRIGSSRMAVVELPMGIVYGFVLLGFVLMSWRAIGVAIANWKRGASVLEQPELSEQQS